MPRSPSMHVIALRAEAVFRVVAHEAEIIVGDLDLAERRGTDRAVLDRHLVPSAGPVVGDRQRLGHGITSCSKSRLEACALAVRVSSGSPADLYAQKVRRPERRVCGPR